ncbi:asparagine synthase (glutamine-hydrolyzing) [Streptomyces albidoflavus]|uniref:asparagine synthase (glutamine-hydrolyzing) n=1 Tax=Streptomyces albidoflavus TaxID=1886 RepID=UPI002E325129|nr:asparagine synthase (glutamine-hydrolyzing) [Streptomyces albidoflavus]WSB15298.1 asparagine synthase (glutamine-hydrolyzing) [Streptomyces albidoflavus]WTC36807.1 asparagine synthase (glutamine-hydrolyzing) [Streptomyces albidoflavus]
MCGIAGWVVRQDGRPREDPAVAEAMAGAMACRGPDEQGVRGGRHVTLVHTRMAVIDLLGGRQPMAADESEDPAATLTYCGEIYNAAELRSDLAGRGHRFRTRSDTEVVLRAYLEWGERCPERLEGMFAFAVWDARTRSLFLARDRFGVKPLYYAETGDGLVFGSEPKALLVHPDVSPEVDLDGLRVLFSMARAPGECVYRSLSDLPPAHTLRFGPDGRLSLRRYWQLEARPHEEDLAGTVATVRVLLESSVARELVSDVPLSVLLSGGLDSSTVAALAARALADGDGGPVRTTTVTYSGYGDNFQPDLVRSAPDSPYARAVAEHIGAEHLEIELTTADLIDPVARRTVLRAQDVPAPFGDMDTSTYQAFAGVRRHSRVALTGESADEIFGGYSWVHIPDLAHEEQFPWVAFEQWHPGTRRGLGQGLLSPAFKDRLDMGSYYAERYAQAMSRIPRLPGEGEEERRAREICDLHLTHWLPRLLERNDRLSMVSGLEVRVPFCDHRLVQYAYNIPWAMKTFDGREKSVLRAAARDLLPERVLDRPKAPFPVSQDATYTKALHQELTEVLADPASPVLPLLDLEAARAVVAREGGADLQDWLHRMNVEMVLQVDAWLRELGGDVEL